MQRNCEKKHSKGSITVEACIVLPFFLSVFFLLLFLVKFTCTGIVLDHAVNETAKEIAAGAYPISFINEIEDEKLEEYGSAGIPAFVEEIEKLAEKSSDTGVRSILDGILTADLEEMDISEALKGILEACGKDLIGNIAGKLKPEYWNMKSRFKYMIADALIREHLNNPLINKENLKLRLAELPQGMAEYAARSGSEAYKSFGLTPGKDFDSDDVVIQLEYRYKVKLPFLEALDLKMVHTSVERAWLKGSSGVLTAEEEGLDLEPEENIVFVTRTGIRYHRGDCRYLRKSRIPTDMEEAAGRGYTPCKVCKP